jgi:hypothetical protein
MTDLTKYVRTPTPANADVRTFLNIELAKIQTATDTFFKMLGDLNMLSGTAEGDFIPKVQGITTAGTATYAIQAGRYLKIGRLVLFQLRVDFTGHTGTGQMQLAGLPYAASASFRADYVISNTNGGLPATTVGSTPPGGQTIDMNGVSHSFAQGMVAAAAFIINGFYFTDT